MIATTAASVALLSFSLATASRPAGAAARGLRVYTHAAGPREQERAIRDLGAAVLVHPPERYDARLTALCVRLTDDDATPERAV